MNAPRPNSPSYLYDLKKVADQDDDELCEDNDEHEDVEEQIDEEEEIEDGS